MRQVCIAFSLGFEALQELKEDGGLTRARGRGVPEAAVTNNVQVNIDKAILELRALQAQ